LQDGSWDTSKGEIIQLSDDLANANIATCKGPAKPWPIPEVPYVWNTTLYGNYYKEPKPQSVIFDPVWKSTLEIPGSEHQVGTDQRKDVGEGPKGDFYMKWQYKDGSQQAYQKAGDVWNE
jgi:hypothetical protein